VLVLVATEKTAKDGVADAAGILRASQPVDFR